MRLLIVISALLLLVLAASLIGFIEGEKAPANAMPWAVVAFVVSMVLLVYLTVTAQSWGGRLGGYVIIAIGCVIFYFFLKANLA